MSIHMTLGVRQEVDRLLKEANSIMMEAQYKGVSKEEKANAKEKCIPLYNQIKVLDPYTYNLITTNLDNE